MRHRGWIRRRIFHEIYLKYNAFKFSINYKNIITVNNVYVMQISLCSAEFRQLKGCHQATLDSTRKVLPLNFLFWWLGNCRRPKLTSIWVVTITPYPRMCPASMSIYEFRPWGVWPVFSKYSMFCPIISNTRVSSTVIIWNPKWPIARSRYCRQTLSW